MSEKKKFPFYQYLLFYLNLVTLLALILAYLSAFIPPRWIPFLQLFGLAFSLLYVANFIFLLFWAYLRRKFFWYNLMILLIGLGLLFRTVNFNRNTYYFPQTFSVLSYNVRYFNIYHWTSDGYTDTKISNFIAKQSPDFVCFQEFMNKNKFNLTKLFSTYPHHYIAHEDTDFSYGLAIFSHYPIVSYGHLNTKNNYFTIYADINLYGTTIRLIDVHLHSVHINYDEYNKLDSLKFGDKQIVSILRKLTTGYQIRQKQVERLVKLIDTTRYPIVLCGDFNDLPVSYTYTLVSSKLKDAFRSLGQGFGQTYFHYLPFLRIDYIFYSNSFQLVNFKRFRVQYSDHYPISAEFSVD